MSTIHNSSKISEVAMGTMVAGEGAPQELYERVAHSVRKFEKHCSSPPATLTPDSDISMAPLSLGILL